MKISITRKIVAAIMAFVTAAVFTVIWIEVLNTISYHTTLFYWLDYLPDLVDDVVAVGLIGIAAIPAYKVTHWFCMHVTLIKDYEENYQED